MAGTPTLDARFAFADGPSSGVWFPGVVTEVLSDHDVEIHFINGDRQVKHRYLDDPSTLRRASEQGLRLLHNGMQ